MIFLTSDTHFGHEKVAKLRGFDSVAEHDAWLAAAWATTVAEDDTMWHLGDVAMGGWRNSLPLLRELPGKKHLVLGNHDRAHPLNSNGHMYADEYLTVFDSVQTAAAIRFMGETWLLSHFPYDDVASRYPAQVVPDGPEWRETRYPGYFANAEGQIKGRFGRVLKPWIAGAGYLYVSIPTGGAGKRNVTVHSLVCEAFHGSGPPGSEVAHGNGDPGDNRPSNLRWTTHKQNMADRALHGTGTGARYSRAGERNGVAKLTGSEVERIRASVASTGELAVEYGVSTSTIRDVRNYRTWTGDHTEDERFPQWRLRDEGRRLFHGHTHGPESISYSKAGTLQVHVGVDSGWGMGPVPLAVIKTELERMEDIA